MVYWIWLKKLGRRSGPFIFTDAFLPGIIPPRRIEQTSCESAEDLGLCEKCTGAPAHVIEEKSGRKFCPVLFSDLVKPKWTAKDLIG
jgi:hypothetical protein